MKADSISLLEFIGASKRTFYIPVYQRNYDWKKENCVTLFRDIESVAVDSKRSSHFLGTLVYVEGESNATFRAFTIIDGQQRLTTIMILLKAIADLCNDENLREDIFESYLTNRRCEEALRIKLKPMKSDAQNFQKLIDGDTEEMEESQILVNYRLFKELLEQSTLSPKTIYDGILKLEIVYIELAKEKENPQLIFESLNSTGLDLTQADLIRNYLLMGQEYHEQELLYNRYWKKLEEMLPDTMISDYIRDYLTLKTGAIPNKDDVYNCFKRYYQSLNNYNAEGFLDEIKTYGEYYQWFKFSNSPFPAVNERLSQFQKLKSTVVYPFLLNIFEDCCMYHNVDSDELCLTMDVLLSYVMRRLLCEMPTNALNKVFSTMARDIDKVPIGSLHEKVIKVLSEKTGKVAFPKDSNVREHLRLRDMYKFPHTKFLLEQIERKNNKETLDFSSLTIEHIMPQTLTAKWRVDLGSKAQEIYDKYLHCLGNLTLTGYNSELSNESYDIKLQSYKNSNVSITRKIAEYSHWGEPEIIKRSDALVDAIIKIWSCPVIINESNLERDTRTDFDFTDEVDVTGRTPVELEIIGEVHSVSSWKDFLQQLCETLYEYDPQVFRSLLTHSDFKGRSRRIIDSESENMRRPLKISEGLCIETNLSANDILNYSKLLLEKFDGMEDMCSYRLRPI